MKFSEVPVGSFFFDGYDDLCQKVDEHNARTPCCAPGFLAGFKPNEVVHLAVKRKAPTGAVASPL